jgi:luciferase family oxidoreductase group 1
MAAAPILYSILDLAPIPQGQTAADAFANTVDLARHAEALGYHRYWLAEHHGMPGVASAATALLIAHVGNHTTRIRVGSGGVMLPNHAPLVIAEQFGTLESLFPGRIDLGIGRAPGSDPATTRALRRHLNGDDFLAEFEDLRGFFASPIPGQGVRAVPGGGLEVPIYLLGSSDFSARLAAVEGLPFAFASHFAPDFLHAALEIYRENFTPSRQLDHPHVIVGVNVFAADTDREAQRQFTSVQQSFLSLIRGTPGQVPPPVDSMSGRWNAAEEQHITRMLRYSAVGSAAKVRAQLQTILDDTQADELMMAAHMYDHAARKHSFALAAGVMNDINAARSKTAMAAAP